jgi:hypothetical protein
MRKLAAANDEWCIKAGDSGGTQRLKLFLSKYTRQTGEDNAEGI